MESSKSLMQSGSTLNKVVRFYGMVVFSVGFNIALFSASSFFPGIFMNNGKVVTAAEFLYPVSIIGFGMVIFGFGYALYFFFPKAEKFFLAQKDDQGNSLSSLYTSLNYYLMFFLFLPVALFFMGARGKFSSAVFFLTMVVLFSYFAIAYHYRKKLVQE